MSTITRSIIGLAFVVVTAPVLAQQDELEPAESAPTELAPADLAPEEPAPAETDPLGPRLTPDQPIPVAELEAYLDGLIELTMQRNHIAGVTVSVVQGGQSVLEKGYGYADLETERRVDPARSLFRIGSITKTFTWIAIMRRVESGELDLDDPINDHLPPELQIPDQGFAEPIRIRHLMTHMPGFEDRALGSLFAREESVRPLARFLAEDRVDRVREPGLFSTYSNYGVGVAGAILEHVDGRPWQEIIEAEIFLPLGLEYTTGREPYARRDDLPAPMSSDLAENVSTGYRWAAIDYESSQYEYVTQVAPAGSMSSTAGDMARYMLMLLGDGELDGARIFGATAANAFRTPMTDWPPEIGNWAAGFFDVVLPGGFHAYGHGGATLTFFADMMVVPDLDLGVFVATNTAGGGALSSVVLFQVVNHFYARKPDALPEGMPSLRETAANYVGSYRGTRRRYAGLEGFFMRVNSQSVWVSPDGFLVAGIIGPPSRFLPTDVPGLFRSVDRPAGIKFEPAEGPAERIVSIGQSYERVGFLDSGPVILTLGSLTLLISVIVLGTLIGKRGYKLPNSPQQQLACHLRVAASLLWVVGAIAGAVTVLPAIEDASAIIYQWPTTGVLVFSSAALAASVLSAGTLLLLPAVWRGEPGPKQWSVWRKLRFSFSIVVFVALGALLASWGGLQPWNP